MHVSWSFKFVTINIVSYVFVGLAGLQLQGCSVWLADGTDF